MKFYNSHDAIIFVVLMAREILFCRGAPCDLFGCLMFVSEATNLGHEWYKVA